MLYDASALRYQTCCFFEPIVDKNHFKKTYSVLTRHTSQKGPLKRRTILLRRDMKHFVFSERKLTKITSQKPFSVGK